MCSDNYLHQCRIRRVFQRRMSSETYIWQISILRTESKLLEFHIEKITIFYHFQTKMFCTSFRDLRRGNKKTSISSSDRTLQNSHSIGRKRLKAIENKPTLVIIGLASSGMTYINGKSIFTVHLHETLKTRTWRKATFMNYVKNVPLRMS